jgi:hypothetical protein
MSWGLVLLAATLAAAVQAVCRLAVSCKGTSSSNSREVQQQQWSCSKASSCEGELQLVAQVKVVYRMQQVEALC